MLLVLAPFATVFSLALLMSVAASPVYLAVDTPTSAGPDGQVDAALVERDLKSTLQKLDGIILSKTDAVEQRMAKKMKKSPATIALRGPTHAVALSIGTLAQKLPLLVDTGSSDLWFFGGFDHSRSISANNTAEDIKLTYVTEAVTGTLASDTVSIGGLSVKKQYFGVVAGEGNDEMSGILGLSFPSLAKINQPTFFSNLLSSGQVTSPSFGLYLSRDMSASGELTLGGSTNNHCTGPKTAVPVVEGLGRWTLRVNDYAVDGKTVLSLPTFAFIDSGSTTSYIPKAAAAAIYAQIPGAYLDTSEEARTTISLNGVPYTLDRYVYPCNATARPGYVFAGGEERTFDVNPQDMSLAAIDATKTSCAGTIIGVDVNLGGATVGILGIDFLKSWYSVFNFGDETTKPTITFAASKA
ncbi:hypothetical protein JCM11641_006580 [Rhodosporidiobolus odoratus]